MNHKTRLVALSLSVLAIGCSSDGTPANYDVKPTSQVGRDRLFLEEMMDKYPDPGMTGLKLLDWAYIYCGEIVEGMPLADVYARIELGANSQYEIDLHQTIVDVSLDTNCVLDPNN